MRVVWALMLEDLALSLGQRWHKLIHEVNIDVNDSPRMFSHILFCKADKFLCN
jgi:hypothetical protein